MWNILWQVRQERSNVSCSPGILSSVDQLRSELCILERAQLEVPLLWTHLWSLWQLSHFLLGLVQLCCGLFRTIRKVNYSKSKLWRQVHTSLKKTSACKAEVTIKNSLQNLQTVSCSRSGLCSNLHRQCSECTCVCEAGSYLDISHRSITNLPGSTLHSVHSERICCRT